MSDSPEQSAPSDYELLRRIATQDRAALRVLFDRHAPIMLGLSVRVLRDRHLAEDLVNEVFLELWQKPDAYSPERGTPRAYLVLLTRSRSVDRLRSMRTHAAGGDHTIQHLDRDDPPASAHRDASPQLAAESSELAGIVQHELGQLAENQRALIDLAYFQGLTHEEIAAHTDVPLGTVKGRVRRGLIALRKRLAARLGRQESRESSSSGTSANHDSDEHAKGADA